MPDTEFLLSLAVMAGITYLLRMIPLVFLKKRIKNRFILSFLHYIPVAVLSVMIIPSVFYASDNLISAAVGFVAAVVLALFEKSLVQVACAACVAVFITELAIKFIF